MASPIDQQLEEAAWAITQKVDVYLEANAKAIGYDPYPGWLSEIHYQSFLSLEPSKSSGRVPSNMVNKPGDRRMGKAINLAKRKLNELWAANE